MEGKVQFTKKWQEDDFSRVLGMKWTKREQVAIAITTILLESFGKNTSNTIRKFD